MDEPRTPSIKANAAAEHAEEPSPVAGFDRPSPPPNRMHNIFVGPEGLRPGWRLFLYFAMGTAIAFLFLSLARYFPKNGAGKLWVGLYAEAVLVVACMVPAWIMTRSEKRPFGSYGLPGAGAFGKLFWSGVVWGIAALSGLLLVMRGLGAFYFGSLALHGERILKFAAFYGVVFLLVGFFEEFTFRGYTQSTLARGMGFWPAAATLSLIFGALHLGNPGEEWVGALSAGLIGLFFCFTLSRTGSLWFAVGMHASWDWSESFLYSVPDSGGMSPGHLLNSSFHGARWLTGGSVGPEGSVLVFLVIGLLWVAFDKVYPGVRSDGATGVSPLQPLPARSSLGD